MNMHFCTARINLSGQGFHIYEFLATDPVSWPEVQVLMALHGEENLYDVKPISISDVSPHDEKRRLTGKYGKIVEQVFPGRSPRMETLMPGEEENQPRADEYGVKLQRAQAPDEDDGEDEVASREPPTTAPVMKPGRHQRPFPGPATPSAPTPLEV